MTDDLEATIGGMTSLAEADVRHDLGQTVEDMQDIAAGRIADPSRFSLPPSVVALGSQVTPQDVMAQRVSPSQRSTPAASQSPFAAAVAFVRRQLGLDD